MSHVWRLDNRDESRERRGPAITAEGDTVWAEWHWTGTGVDGSPFAMRGVTLLGIADDRIAWGRLYMEEVEQAGEDINQAVRRFVEKRQSSPRQRRAP
jgi:hypothetical protein